MKIISKDTKWEGNFLKIQHYNLYDGRKYEVCSRINKKEIDAVDIIAFNTDLNKVCVVLEYRPAVEGYILSFPAGLCEEGEKITETASRELFEECGLEFFTLIDILLPSFQSPGLTNESCATVFCTAIGEATNKNAQPDEYIHPFWITKEQAKLYLESGHPISARCQMFLTMWSSNYF